MNKHSSMKHNPSKQPQINEKIHQPINHPNYLHQTTSSSQTLNNKPAIIHHNPTTANRWSNETMNYVSINMYYPATN
jgi:hypothetical protein